MNPKPIEQAKTPDLEKSMPALRRAAQNARKLARQTVLEDALVVKTVMHHFEVL